MAMHVAPVRVPRRWLPAVTAPPRPGVGSPRGRSCRRLPWHGLVLLAAACASPPPGAASLRIDVQVRAAASDAEWSPPLAHHPRVQRAHVGEVVVPGIWTVVVAWTAEDTAWFGELEHQHLELLVTIDGKELLTDGRTGYVKDLGSRSAAETMLARLPVLEPPPK